MRRMIQPTATFPIVSPGLCARSALPWVSTKRAHQPERVSEPPPQLHGFANCFRVHSFTNRLDPRTLPWAEICQRLRRLFSDREYFLWPRTSDSSTIVLPILPRMVRCRPWSIIARLYHRCAWSKDPTCLRETGVPARKQLFVHPARC